MDLKASLRWFPNTAAGVALGLGGHALLWKNVHMWPASGDSPILEILNLFFWWLALLIGVIIFLAYALKVAFHRDIVVKEWVHPVRFNFFCGPPAMFCCFIGMALPVRYTNEPENNSGQQVGWCIVASLQVVLSTIAYRRWIFKSSTEDAASAPYLLCIVSWFLLSVWGQTPPCRIDELGLPFVAATFGIGTFWIAIVYPIIITGIFPGRTKQGHPALFLLLAPPSVAAIAVGGPSLNDGFGPASEAIFGSMVFLFLVLLSGSPQYLKQPEVFGVYWAYVFPPCALCVLSMKLESARVSSAFETLTWILICITVAMLVMVFSRMTAHQVQVCRGDALWNDPLVPSHEPESTLMQMEQL
eukprot:TRINITY_DN7387_c0_g1_i1.p1 TRINITY_DN7387_c0_g1~~TRINITY_DN7387_c0_g1_i1.p1  ORF type:complete len:358 (-),score=33.05 TRINITY_DN7387_c0_g1_i1:94-1167(-)